MSRFLGLDYVGPASIDAVAAEELAPKLSGGGEPVVFGPVRWRVEIGLEPRAFARAGGRVAAHRARHGLSRAFLLPMPQLVAMTVPDGAVLQVVDAARPARPPSGSSPPPTWRCRSGGSSPLPATPRSTR